MLYSVLECVIELTVCMYTNLLADKHNQHNYYF